MSTVVTLEGLEAELAEVCGQLNVLQARLVELTAAALASGAWEQWGIHTPAQWLAWKAGLSRGTARTVVAVAERVGELPATASAFAAGELTLDQVAPIAAHAPVWAEAEACALAKNTTVAQLRRVVTTYAFKDEPAESPAPVQPAYVSLTPRADGRWRLSGLLDADQGGHLERALAEARDALFSRNEGPASLADAIAEIACRSLDKVTSTARRDRYRTHIHIDALTGLTTDGNGLPIARWLRRLAGCDGSTSTVIASNGHPVEFSDPKAAIPAVIRRHVRRRDRRCRVPGCESQVVELHHILHREDGGDHHVTNLCGLCPRHHRLHHLGLLHIEGDAEAPDGLTFANAQGVPFAGGSVARPPTAPLPKPTGSWRHPLGERLKYDQVWFNPPATTTRT